MLVMYGEAARWFKRGDCAESVFLSTKPPPLESLSSQTFFFFFFKRNLGVDRKYFSWGISVKMFSTFSGGLKRALLFNSVAALSYIQRE